MRHKYSVSEFYLLLKLGIWKSGTVNFWGEAVVVQPGGIFSQDRDLHSRYGASSPLRKHLDVGLYLLDMSCMGRDMKRGMNMYRLVVAACRNDMLHLESLYDIQIRNAMPAKDFFAALGRNDGAPDNSRLRKKSLFNHPGRIRTNLTPVWQKYIFRR